MLTHLVLDRLQLDRRSTADLIPALPPPFAGEGGPCVSRGRERGATLPKRSRTPDPSCIVALPSPDLA
ncbi:hypothetical protein FVA80_28465 [Methylobacterium sp. WL1]|nr:hypothetical protein FVA80_28465 [Methylobacterium sp. WL1]